MGEKNFPRREKKKIKKVEKGTTPVILGTPTEPVEVIKTKGKKTEES